MLSSSLWHGWYSPKMDAVSGACYWKGIDGVTVRVTCVTESPKESGVKWPDVEYVGPVTEHSHGHLKELCLTEIADYDYQL